MAVPEALVCGADEISRPRSLARAASADAVGAHATAWGRAGGAVQAALSEVGELSAAIASGDKQNAKEELGDVLMWLLTLANLLNVDMEDVIKEYLNNPRKLPSK